MSKVRRTLKVAWIPVAAAFGPFAMVFPTIVGFTIPFPVGVAFCIAGAVGVTALLQRMLQLEMEVRRMQGKAAVFYGQEEGDDLPKIGQKRPVTTA